VSAPTALERLAKWRLFFASWQLGSRPKSDGEAAAVRDHREVTIMLRAEMNALARLLIRKGVISEAEFSRALLAEARQLDEDYQRSYPGWRATTEGMAMDMPEALETMKKLGFPP
jgi:hypothetical protein